ncbi:MAG: T9SS type A sorting domain-containing protein [Fibrobacteria bacterium]|nr:T9SS type A sorting domain-containing protein [Fibrobacteria bacterium]
MNFKIPRFLKSFRAVFMVLSLCFSGIMGQATFTKCPIDKQLYARDLTTSLADVTFEGTVDKTADNYTQITLTIYREGEKQGDATVNQLNYNGSTAPFSITHKIKAELANYKFEVHLKNASKTQLVKTINEVVAGDVYVLQGQSNAAAGDKAGSSAGNDFNSPFIRVYGSGNSKGYTDAWFIGKGAESGSKDGGTGQWGIVMAKLIVDEHKIPVAIFNEGLGGAWIELFPRNDADPDDAGTNYGRLLTRLNKTGLKSSVRSILWYQGESNAMLSVINTQQYKTLFYQLLDDWHEDYPSVEKYYVFQIRMGCGGSEGEVGNIKEALRQLAEENSEIEAMSTSNCPHMDDNCHYEFYDGYERSGRNVYRLLNRDLYGKVGEKNIEPPRIMWAEVWGSNEIRLIMKNVGDSLIWYPGAQKEFRLQGASASLSSGSTWKNHVILTSPQNVSSATAISYAGAKRISEAPMVKTPKEVGAMHFWGFPVTKPYTRDSASIKAILDSNKLNLSVAQVSEKDASNRISTLLLSGLTLSKIPENIGYMDAVTKMRLDSSGLTELPESIIYLTPTEHLSVNNNRLCALSIPVKEWVDKYAVDKDWLTTQNCNSFTNRPEHIVHSSVTMLNGTQMKITLEQLVKVLTINMYDLEGKIVSRFNFSPKSKETIVQLPLHSAGVYLISLHWKNNRTTQKIAIP